MSGFSWRTDTLFKGLDIERISAAINMKAETEAVRLQGHMQTQRPWTDRTGQAKRTLSAEAERKSNAIVITLAHGVEYGKWLEIRWNERYSIIKPTIATQSARVMASMQGLLDRL